MSIKIRRKRISVILILVLIGGIIVGCGQSNTKKEGPVQIKMEKYIKDTYKEDFVVEVPMMHSSFGLHDYSYAVAYPKKDKSLKFEIDYRESKFSDTYMEAKWSKEGKPIVENKLKEIYGEDINYYFKVEERISDTSESIIRKMNYQQVLASNPNICSINLTYYVFLDSQLNKQKEAEKVFEILKSIILDNKLGYYNVSIYFISSQYKDYFTKTNKDIGDFDDDEMYKSGRVLNVIYIAEIDKITNIEDVLKKFQY